MTHPRDAYETMVDRALARRISASAGAATGSTWRAMPTATVTKKTARAPMPGATATGSSTRVNDDMPFDQFTIEQTRGRSSCPNATPEQIVATAFHRQTLTNTEGGTDQEQFRVEAVFDRTETTGAVWLGLTVGCARCHTHKYDQITPAGVLPALRLLQQRRRGHAARCPTSPEAWASL